MGTPRATLPAWLGTFACGLLVFFTCNAAYQGAPVHQLTDSQYAVFQTELGADFGSWTMNGHMDMPRFGATPEPLPYHRGQAGLPYQLQVVPDGTGQRVVHWYPPGTMLLATPLYWLARELTWLPPHVEIEAFNGAAEDQAQGLLAGWLTAAFAVATFLLARGWLPLPWAVATTWAVALGTMAFSTQSRGLWSSTGAVLCQALAVAELVRPFRPHDPRPMRPWLLATWMAWAWFCRPSEAIHLVLLTLFVLWQARAHVIQLGAVGLAWLLAFLAWSRHTYGDWLPDYYRHGHLTTAHLGTSLLANTLSPGRGFVVYAPVTLGILWVLWRFRRQLVDTPLLWLAGAAMAAHLALLAVYPTWWAGHAYGARFCVELLPWLSLAGVIAVASARAAALQPENKRAWQRSSGVLAVLAVAGVGINLPAGHVAETLEWNIAPIDVNRHPEDAVWNWRYPPFLAGTIGWPASDPLPVWPIGQTVMFGAPGKDQPFLLERWGGAEQGHRWAYGPSARLGFALPEPTALDWTIEASTYCPRRTCDQSFHVRWNGHPLAPFRLNVRRPVTVRYHVPASVVARENIVTIQTDHGTTPHSVTGVRDFRPLGLAVRTMTLTPTH